MKIKTQKLKQHDSGDAWKEEAESRWNYNTFQESAPVAQKPRNVLSRLAT